MRRRVVPGDFESVGTLIDRGQKTRSSWFVCEEYGLHEGAIRARPDAYEGPQEYEVYQPLHDVPDLFLRFARLYKERNFSEAALAWSHKYGLPGGDSLGKFSSVESIELSMFWEEAKRAWIILALYEAVLNRDAQVVRNIVGDDLCRSDELLGDFIERLHEGRSDEEYLSVALSASVDSVDWVVYLLCRPQLCVPVLSSDPSDVRSRWDFDNLLGAMYLQMYWLMESGGEVTRCKYCGLTISLARPHPKGRKPPSHKRFCDDACRQAHHRANKRP